MSNSIIERLEALELAVKNLEQRTNYAVGFAINVQAEVQVLRGEIFGKEPCEAEEVLVPGIAVNVTPPPMQPPRDSNVLTEADVWNIADEAEKRFAPKAPAESGVSGILKSEWTQTVDHGPVQAWQFGISPAKIVAKIKKARKVAPKKVGRKTRTRAK